jgi:Fur family transcriptional regulator, ferric uptake regulator
MEKKESLKILKNVLKKERLRLTDQRVAIWNQIRNSKKHVDVEEIFSLLKAKKQLVSRATIYRTLDVLVKNRLIRKMDVGDGYSLYEPRVDNDHHDHMICEDTGDIIEFFSEELELLQEKIARDHGYTVIRHTHQLFVKKI